MNLLDHIASVAALTGRADHDPAALAADEHLRYEWYRAAVPIDERAFLAAVLRDPDPAMAIAAVVTRIDAAAKSTPDFAEWAAYVEPAVAQVD
ncbi:MAG: hypothetical protein M3548_17310, partial [Actinomycetota bacterium]|nr:hypothetical protein [Actinomycetota bacterium]